jgi:hypothetical protein
VSPARVHGVRRTPRPTQCVTPRAASRSRSPSARAGLGTRAYLRCVEGCGPPAGSSGGFRTPPGRPAAKATARIRGSSPHIPPITTDGCVGARVVRGDAFVAPPACQAAKPPRLRASRRVAGGGDGNPASRHARRNKCSAPDSRSKWRKTGDLERRSGYHAGNHVSVPMLGRIPATGAHHSHRPAFLPQDRASGPEPESTGLGNSRRAPDIHIRH